MLSFHKISWTLVKSVIIKYSKHSNAVFRIRKYFFPDPDQGGQLIKDPAISGSGSFLEILVATEKSMLSNS